MNGIHYLDSGAPGKTLAIIGGIHGDERVGVLAIDRLRRTLPDSLLTGSVYLIYGNPMAIGLGDEFIHEVNLNRLFSPNTPREGLKMYERAHELMSILSRCDACLDIHSYTGTEGPPFLICEPSGLPIVQKMNVEVVSTGWAHAQPGATDDFMHSLGKVGICLEAGVKSEPELNAPLAYDCALQFLGYYGLIASPQFYKRPQRHLIVYEQVLKKNEEGALARSFHTFERLEEGTLIGHDGVQEYRAGISDVILFPRESCLVGQSLFLRARERSLS